MENTTHQTKFGKSENEQKFYALIPHNSANLDLTDECALSFDKTLYCPKCQNIKYSTSSIPPISIYNVSNKKFPLYWIHNSVYLTVINDVFLEALKYIDPQFQYFAMGEVYDQYGVRINDFYSIKPFNYAITRGSYKNFSNICEVCGNVHCWPNGPDLYVSLNIDNQIPIWGMGLPTELIISYQVLQEIQKRKLKFKKIVEVKPIEISDPKFNLDIPLFILDKGKNIIYPPSLGSDHPPSLVSHE